MNIALTAFTRQGAALAQSLTAALEQEGHRCALSLPKSLAGALHYPHAYGTAGSWAKKQFGRADALLFVGAAGIAVRSVAPWVKDKFTDPAVLSMDELGRYVIPLLSGHVGGANALARRIAALTGGTAVISTATDVNGLFAVDEWAAQQGMSITDRALAKEVSASLLKGEPVGFVSDFAHACPEGLSTGPAPLGVWVTYRSAPGPFPRTLRLVPRRLYLGLGCRRGAGEAAIRAAVEEALSGIDLSALAGAATIDLKREEEGLLSYCCHQGLPLTFFTAAELSALPGDFTPSRFVESVTGVDNVCERAAAALSKGPIVRPKRARDGVTIAIAESLA